MSAQGVAFLENWIAKNIRSDTTPAEVKDLAARCLVEAAKLDISPHDMESDWGSVEKTIREAIMHLAQPGE